MTRRSDPNPAYREQYGPFQQVKHELIRCYLNGWYPKLGTWARRVLRTSGLSATRLRSL